MKTKQIIIIIGVLLAGIIIGRYWAGGDGPPEDTHTEEVIYTCSMHPSVRQEGPGSCPICGMDLVPAGDLNGEPTGPETFRMTERAARIAEVQTQRVEKSVPKKQIRLNGTLQRDERLVKSQTAHFPGRIEELNVNFTGQVVRRGEVIASIYSPEMVTAQRELLDALRHKENNPSMLASAREKLKQWKISDRQIREIEESGEAKRLLPVHAESSGYVTKRLKDQGDYVNTGDPIYQTAETDRLWVVFEAYEQDIPWIKSGDTITFRANRHSATEHTAIAEFIDQEIDPQTRVARIRATVDNKDGVLRPGMFVEGTMQGSIQPDPIITVPRSAVMWTGPRSVVYIRDADADEPLFHFREVTLGDNLGDRYIIHDGIEEGELLVINGTFRIDAAAQLHDKASMMRRHVVDEAPSELKTHDYRDETPEAFKEDIQSLFKKYTKLSNALADDDPAAAHEWIHELNQVLEVLTTDRLSGAAHELFHEHREAMKSSIQDMHESDLEGMREKFEYLSLALRAVIESFGIKDTEVFILNCPMAFDNRGADWLYDSREILNPYFGDKMLRCGRATEHLTE